MNNSFQIISSKNSVRYLMRTCMNSRDKFANNLISSKLKNICIFKEQNVINDVNKIYWALHLK